MNEQTNECKNMKNTILLQAVALISGNRIFRISYTRFVYLAKKFMPFGPKNSAEFLAPPEFSRNVLEKDLNANL